MRASRTQQRSSTGVAFGDPAISRYHGGNYRWDAVHVSCDRVPSARGPRPFASGARNTTERTRQVGALARERHPDNLMNTDANSAAASEKTAAATSDAAQLTAAEIAAQELAATELAATELAARAPVRPDSP